MSEETPQDVEDVVSQHVEHHRRTIPILLGHKPPERQTAILERTIDYETQVLPGILISRDEIRRRDEESWDQ